MWISLLIFSSVFLSNQFLKSVILFKRHDSVSETIFNWSDWCWIFRQNWKQYCDILIKCKFSLFVKELINVICFIIWIVIEWLVQITVSAKNLFIIWWIFLIIQTKQIIFNFVDQYWASASVKSLLRKKINLIFCQFFLTVWSSRLSWSFCMW